MFINHYIPWFPDNEDRVPAAGGKRALFGVQVGSGGSVIAVRPPGWAIGGGASPARARHS